MGMCSREESSDSLDTHRRDWTYRGYRRHRICRAGRPGSGLAAGGSAGAGRVAGRFAGAHAAGRDEDVLPAPGYHVELVASEPMSRIRSSSTGIRRPHVGHRDLGYMHDLPATNAHAPSDASASSRTPTTTGRWTRRPSSSTTSCCRAPEGPDTACSWTSRRTCGSRTTRMAI